MLQLFHMDVVKVDQGMLQVFQRHVASICSKCFICFQTYVATVYSKMFHIFQSYVVASVFILQAFVQNDSSVSRRLLQLFFIWMLYMLQQYVPNVLFVLV